jgi:hypothetical protein
MFVVLAKGRTVEGLEGVVGTTREMTTTADGERVFVIRRDLKED